MTTRNDNYLDRILRLGQGKADTQGTNTKAFVDPNNEYPRKDNHNQSSINQRVHQLSIGGSVADVSLDLDPPVKTYYGKADIRETASGHVIELNDTPGGERVLIKHKTGAGIELRPDGTVLVVSTKNKVEICHGSNEVIVEGEATLSYKGNLTLNVTGDYNVNCRDYNVHARGSKTEQIDNNSATTVFGNYGNSVSGTFVQSVAGNTTNLTLGTQTLVTKGDLVVATEGSQEIVSKGPSIYTSEEQINLSSPDINIVAKDIAVAGSRGTIGGGKTVLYGETIHGNLKGTADKARRLGTVGISIFNSLGSLLVDGSGTSGAGSINFTSTANPTEGMTESYLTVGDRGIRKIHIDIDDYLKNQLLTRTYSVDEVRAKMRDKNNRDFSEWTAYQIASGVLNANYANNVPSSYGSIVLTNQPQERRGINSMGQIEPLAIVQKYKPPQLKVKFNIAPEARFKSNMSGIINQNTLINHDTSIGKFVGFDDHGEFNKLSNAVKQQIAKNYFVISELMKLVSNSNIHPTELENSSLIVVEGYYATEKYGIGSLEKRQTEVLTSNSTLDMRSKGRAVVFELRDQKGKVDKEATFELAKIWSDAGTFDKLILDYDTYDPSGELNTQIIIEVPDIKSYSGIKFARNVQTLFNNNVQSNDALVEIEL
jgi:hypothetical protein